MKSERERETQRERERERAGRGVEKFREKGIKKKSKKRG